MVWGKKSTSKVRKGVIWGKRNPFRGITQAASPPGVQLIEQLIDARAKGSLVFDSFDLAAAEAVIFDFSRLLKPESLKVDPATLKASALDHINLEAIKFMQACLYGGKRVFVVSDSYESDVVSACLDTLTREKILSIPSTAPPVLSLAFNPEATLAEGSLEALYVNDAKTNGAKAGELGHYPHLLHVHDVCERELKRAVSSEQILYLGVIKSKIMMQDCSLMEPADPNVYLGKDSVSGGFSWKKADDLMMYTIGEIEKHHGAKTRSPSTALKKKINKIFRGLLLSEIFADGHDHSSRVRAVWNALDGAKTLEEMEAIILNQRYQTEEQQHTDLKPGLLSLRWADYSARDKYKYTITKDFSGGYTQAMKDVHQALSQELPEAVNLSGEERAAAPPELTIFPVDNDCIQMPIDRKNLVPPCREIALNCKPSFEFVRKVTALLDQYADTTSLMGSLWRHHRARARAISKAIVNAESHAQIEAILWNQKGIFSGNEAQIETVLSQGALLGSRWSELASCQRHVDGAFSDALNQAFVLLREKLPEPEYQDRPADTLWCHQDLRYNRFIDAARAPTPAPVG
ncbi:MAG: hypothetical protein K0U29_07855 [Gammaproteobacteria bacterium]|nr:hypothetical protein [Gammaproteobacteria bacterium]